MFMLILLINHTDIKTDMNRNHRGDSHALRGFSTVQKASALMKDVPPLPKEISTFIELTAEVLPLTEDAPLRRLPFSWGLLHHPRMLT